MLFKNTMKWFIMMTIIITISSKSWFIYWLMMEMNLLMFIPIMNTNKKNNSNSMITYFVIQSFSSTLFFFSAMNSSIFYQTYIFNYFMMISIMIKLAMIPFHFWLSSMSEMIDYSSMFIILTLQKFIPLYILTNLNSKMLIIFASISALFGSMFAFNLKSFKKILIFSSISHQGWMTALIMIKSNFWISYLMMYSLLIYKISFFLEKSNYNLIMNKFFMFHNNNKIKISLMSMMLSLGGMPPFFGFMIKLISVMILIKYSNLIIIILIISSMINIFFYIRIITPNLFLNIFKIKNILKYNQWSKNLILNMNIMITMFMLNLMLL
uniref:NADH dehydrogenase subunit 2 n=1 Tax=Amblyomma naponense TaxID=251387 RepID=UPI002E75A1BA|nr:NADH dehydrogenase subunit 2 [Amblyomma naponense]WQF68991.1 NADH dehydrogenase subunit 2 [Amblyomma naponense]